MNDTALSEDVVSPGFEPGLKEPKTLVLSLHHETINIVAGSRSTTLQNYKKK